MTLPLGPLLAAALLSGCARPAPEPGPATEYLLLGALELSATVERDLWDVYGAVELMNTGGDTVRLEYASQCALAILVYRPAADRGRRWDSSEWWQRRQGECPATPVRLDIPPLTLARVIAPAVDADAILGDSLPAGAYAAAMRMRLLQPTDTTLLLNAGEVELERPEKPGHLVGTGLPSPREDPIAAPGGGRYLTGPTPLHPHRAPR